MSSYQIAHTSDPKVRTPGCFDVLCGVALCCVVLSCLFNAVPEPGCPNGTVERKRQLRIAVTAYANMLHLDRNFLTLSLFVEDMQIQATIV
jgi:hypothetical protein